MAPLRTLISWAPTDGSGMVAFGSFMSGRACSAWAIDSLDR